MKKGNLENFVKESFMQTRKDESLNGLYLLQSQLTRQQLIAAIGKCLCKAEALATIATIVDFETQKSDIQSDYFWALSDVIHEAKWLYEKMIT
jgi:hypothetical protein